MTGNPEPTTHFGFRDIPVAEKKPMVRAVFDSVAQKYDVMNDLMSLGVHRAWKSISPRGWIRARTAPCSTSPAAPATSRCAGWKRAAARPSCPTSTKAC
jgi:hypothetical protein